MSTELSREHLCQMLAVVVGWEQIVDEDGLCDALDHLATLVGFTHCALLEHPSRRIFSGGAHDSITVCRLDDLAPDVRSLLVDACDQAQSRYSASTPSRITIALRSARTNAVVGSLCLTAERPYLANELAMLSTITPFLTAMLERLATAREAANSARRKDVFLARLGHDLRSPLATISSTIAAMRIRSHPPSDAELELIERQLGYMTRLADDLVDASLIARGKVALDLNPVDLPLMVERGLERAGVELSSRGHTVVVDVPTTSLFVLADLDRLSNVVRKIVCSISRRLDHGARIKVEVTRMQEQAHLRVSQLTTSRRTELASGSGGWPLLDRDPTLDGLDTEMRFARQIVELHGGKLATLGGPTEIDVILPRTRILTGQHPIVPSTPATRRDIRPCRVLIVDDDVDLADAVSTMLRELGHTTEIAHDGEQALAVIEEFVPDVALISINLPGMDGYQLAHAIRTSAKSMDIRLIAMTGLAATADMVHALSAGFDERLVKPVDLGAMARAIHPN